LETSSVITDVPYLKHNLTNNLFLNKNDDMSPVYISFIRSKKRISVSNY